MINFEGMQLHQWLKRVGFQISQTVPTLYAWLCFALLSSITLTRNRKMLTFVSILPWSTSFYQRWIYFEQYTSLKLTSIDQVCKSLQIYTFIASWTSHRDISLRFLIHSHKNRQCHNTFNFSMICFEYLQNR